MQDEFKVKAAHFWIFSRTLIRSFESEADLDIVLLHAIAPYCNLAVPRRKGLFVLKDIPAPLSAQGSQVYSTYVKEIVSAANYTDKEHSRIIDLLHKHLDTLIAAIAGHLSYSDHQQNLAKFELIIEKILTRQKAIHPYHSLIVSHLAQAVQSGFECCDEYFPHSGDLQISAKRAHGYSSIEATVFHPAVSESLLRLRLLAYDIRLNTENTFPSEERRTHRSFLLVDQGGRKLDEQKGRGSPVLSDIIDKMLYPPADFYPLSIVVLHHALPVNLFDRLVASRQISAIVDFETLTPAGRTTIATAVVLSARALPPDEKILFIDITKFTRWSDSPVLATAAELAGSILALGLKRGRPTGEFGEHRYAALLKRFYHSNFTDTYEDVSGICERLVVNISKSRGKKLRAADYLTPTTASQTPGFLDTSPILSALPPDAKNRSCVYVIGNNGVGKSFLLRELAVNLSKHAITTYGIAFGLTDRFGFNPAQKPEFFHYLGTGSLRGSNTLKAHCSTLANLTSALYRDDARLNAFQIASMNIGLTGRYYLMPWKMTSSDIENDKGLSDINPLEHLDHEVDFSSNYKLGVVRDQQNGAITPFDELSSGEQQLFSLIIKIAASATAGAVVLIDEPEISLHVSWQQALPGLLNSLSQSLACSFVVATHSPVITANAINEEDLCFAASGKKLEAITITQRRSVESALFEGFETYTPNNRQIHERCAVIIASAIRSTNQTGRASDQELHAFQQELENMQKIVENPKNKKITQHHSDDVALILKAQMVINELGSSMGNHRE